MPKIYSVNIGPNTSHRTKARIPLFEDGQFVYVTVPTNKNDPGENSLVPYPSAQLPFLNGGSRTKLTTHADPDWKNLTYGDCLKTPRAKALKWVEEDDILLFWSALWPCSGRDWQHFNGDCLWAFVGAIRIETSFVGKELKRATGPQKTRALKNAHVLRGGLPDDDVVFVGQQKYSCLFSKAVDLEVGDKNGLMAQTIQSTGGTPLWKKSTPRWNSSLRSCRVIWDLDDKDARKRAKIARNRILKVSGFDLLKDLGV